MQEVYFKTIILPTRHPDLFVAFLLDFTQEAIEESLAPSLPYEHFGASAPLPQEGFIVYSQHDPKPLLKALKEFCTDLSERTGDLIGFYHHSAQHKNKDWIEAYKAGVSPIVCGDFAINPSWAADPLSAPICLSLDPSLAFGTGHHESTRLLLQAFSPLEVAGQMALDVGCGSGILGLALAKKGARVHLCDTDPLALEETQKNFAKNHATYEKLWLGSVAGEDYDLIVVNIVASVIVELYPAILKASHAKTQIFLSGILNEHTERVLETYTNAFNLKKRTQENEWVCLHLSKS
ncbi:Ribosomal protein L11 methyltransferase PrmA [Helicobacter ailurogastricus]|uniref:50S ribosomal protein L11 methyltransferase n=1 Tax=Helicobacter ailurogastricus TaxID=1578720 RepID=UPI00244D8D73|nr:50S ribosomal protein L11 methyltransferase [Helicobacter ailurogastricus]GMB90122.1 Ribosomal protein L11 methyltransferase PrmA [Helicobacter ailurogastricus]